MASGRRAVEAALTEVWLDPILQLRIMGNPEGAAEYFEGLDKITVYPDPSTPVEIPVGDEDREILTLCFGRADTIHAAATLIYDHFGGEEAEDDFLILE